MVVFNRLTKFVYLFSFLGFLTFLFSCYSQATLDDVVGIYTDNHGKGLDILKMNSDGTYEHIYTEKNKKSQVNRNKWIFEMLKS